MTETKETWPAVFARYWSVPDDDTIKIWDIEFRKVFGITYKGANIVTEEMICDAVRLLGTDGKHVTHRPKVGDIIVQMKATREKTRREEEVDNAPVRAGSCVLCRGEGWVMVPFVEFLDNGKRTRRWPKPAQRTIVKENGDVVDVIMLEEHSKCAYPCLLCRNGGDQFFQDKNNTRASTVLFLQSYLQWLKDLPDQCIDKPEALRVRPYQDAPGKAIVFEKPVRARESVAAEVEEEWEP